MSDVRLSQPRIVCVLGMHRSGTSLLTRLLNLLGVDLGPEEHLMAPNEYNSKGYWEHQPLTDLNDELLLRLGGSWHEPPIFFPGWESAPTLSDLRQRARALIREDFAAAELWGWKDPRMCLTLPFWQRLLPPMEYVICFRNPVDVARSLHHRDGFSFEKGANLWLMHVKSALDHTAGQLRLFVFYEDLMEHWPEELERLARFVERPGLAEQAEIQKAVKESIDEALEHHRTALIDTVDEPKLAYPAKALYMVLRLYVRLQPEEPSLQSDEDQRLQKAIEGFSFSSSEAQAETDNLRTQVLERENQLQALQAQVAEGEQELQALQAQVTVERERLTQQVQQLQAAKMALEGEVGRLRQHLEMVFQSRSWKLTAPLRRIRSGLRTLGKWPRDLWRRGKRRLLALLGKIKRVSSYHLSQPFLQIEGFCPTCDQKVTFFSQDSWLRDHFQCSNCGSIPRERALMYAIEMYYPNFRDLIVHESSPIGRGASTKLARECKQYSFSFYDPLIPLGAHHPTSGYRSENLENMTFENEFFDLIITQDVFEHIFNPERGFSEVARVLKPGGAHIFTAPLVNQLRPSERCAILKPDGTIEHLKKPEYHGNPVDSKGSLVTMYWGYDICEWIYRASGLFTMILKVDNLEMGIRAELNEVLISFKS